MGKYFEPEMLKINNLNFASEATVLFQRLSVIATDFVFALGVKQCAEVTGCHEKMIHIINIIIIGRHWARDTVTRTP